MSWLDRIQDNITIVTGDGSEWQPKWKPTQYIQEFNISSFEFPNIEGTLVRKKQPKGRKFQLEIYFQGEDHLDVSEAFRVSSADQRPWRITHPYYDDILCHPSSLTFDNRGYNVSKITGTLLETILDIFPDSSLNAEDDINERKDALDEQAASSYESSIDSIDSNNAAVINDSMTDLEVEAEKISIGDQVSAMKNLVSKGVNAVNSGIGKAEGFVRAVQNTINYPFQIINSVSSRLDAFKNSFDRLGTSLGTLLGKNDRKYYEAYGATGISGGCQATFNQKSEFVYNTREEVDEITTAVLEIYNNFIFNLDENQSETATEEDAFIPDAETIKQLEEVVTLTVSNLFEIALEAKQEQILILEADSDPITLAHRIYGLDAEDEVLEKFVENNQINLNNIFFLEKGMEIKYYV